MSTRLSQSSLELSENNPISSLGGMALDSFDVTCSRNPDHGSETHSLDGSMGLQQSLVDGGGEPIPSRLLMPSTNIPDTVPDRQAIGGSGPRQHEDTSPRHDGNSTASPSAQVNWEDPEEEHLIRHYRQTVSKVLMPISNHSNNHWAHLYLPLALESPACVATSALRNATLAVSALHLSQSPDAPPSSTLSAKASSHTIEAKRLIKESLESQPPESKPHKLALLAATLTLITMHGYDSRQDDFKEYFDLAREVMEATGSIAFWKSPGECSTLFQIFRGYEVIATTAQERSSARVVEGENEEGEPSLETPTWSLNEMGCAGAAESEDSGSSASQEVFSPGEQYVLDSSFGVGIQTISLLHRILRMDRQFSRWNPSRGDDMQLIGDFEQVRQQLYDISTNPEAFNSNLSSRDANYGQAGDVWSRDPLDGVTVESPLLPAMLRDELLENHQWAFHYAVILFFGRLFETPQSIRWNARYIGNGEPTWTKSKSPFTNYQLLVARVFDHLENLESLTRGTTVLPANTLWPAFIAGVEAIDVDNRQRALLWFRRASKRRFGNVARAKQLLLEVWRRVDRNIDSSGHLPRSSQSLSGVDWRHVMRERGPPIMLT
ncbi:unnamed protein product [Clonostachys byssicola]|uniref:Uncharacterized protein n=1 Tax=Clonostachys byssicola TaxID=160290 RepID=A0A9N9XYH8_9HYPO|nr:unnamed protein product [Clonostachys byssicola]